MNHPAPDFDPNFVFPMLKKIRGRVRPDRRQAQTNKLLDRPRHLVSRDKPAGGMSLLSALAARK